MPSMENMLSTISQVTETLLKGINTLANADIHELEALGLLIGISIAITGFKKLIYHRR